MFEGMKLTFLEDFKKELPVFIGFNDTCDIIESICKQGFYDLHNRSSSFNTKRNFSDENLSDVFKINKSRIKEIIRDKYVSVVVGNNYGIMEEDLKNIKKDYFETMKLDLSLQEKIEEKTNGIFNFIDFYNKDVLGLTEKKETREHGIDFQLFVGKTEKKEIKLFLKYQGWYSFNKDYASNEKFKQLLTQAFPELKKTLDSEITTKYETIL